MEQHSTITVRNNVDRRRYELLDGDTVIGKAHRLPFEATDGSQRIFYHTTVDDAYTGQGLASRLARYALDDSIHAGISIVPVCPYIKSWLRKHLTHQSHAVHVRPEHLAVVPN